MNTNYFDALLSPACPAAAEDHGAELRLGSIKTGVRISKYGPASSGDGEYAALAAGTEIDIKWMDGFDVIKDDGTSLKGLCLWPGARDDRSFKPARRDALLELLASGETGMLLALAEIEGMRGLDETTLAGFTRLTGKPLEDAAVSLEGEGKLLILSFDPLFLVARSTLDFMKDRIVGYLHLYHEKHPDRTGVDAERLGKRFPSHPKVLQLALRSLEKEGRLVPEDDSFRLLDFRAVPNAEDLELLSRLETVFKDGEIIAGKLDEIQGSLNVSPWKLQSLLTVLVERKRVLMTADGFYLHSDWLQKLIGELRSSGKQELSVAEFKKMTGFSRKFAIPLLELLDRMGITRRKGSTREILPER